GGGGTRAETDRSALRRSSRNRHRVVAGTAGGGVGEVEARKPHAARRGDVAETQGRRARHREQDRRAGRADRGGGIAAGGDRLGKGDRSCAGRGAAGRGRAEAGTGGGASPSRSLVGR